MVVVERMEKKKLNLSDLEDLLTLPFFIDHGDEKPVVIRSHA